MNYVKDLTQDYTETLLYYLYINDYESGNDSHNRIINLLNILFRDVGNKNNVLMIKDFNMSKKIFNNAYKDWHYEVYNDDYYKMTIARINKDIIVYLEYTNIKDDEYEHFLFFEKRLENKINRIIEDHQLI